MTALESGRATRYDCAVLATAGAGRGNPCSERRTAPGQAFFYARPNPLNGELRGATERLAGVLSGQFSTPALARHSRCGKRSGGLQFLKGVPL